MRAIGGTKKNEPTELKKVYLYKLNSNGIVEKYGELHKYGYSRWMFKGGGIITEVAGKSGNICRRTVWFDEPNFEKAKGLFIEYEQNLISQAKKKIESSKEMIKIIKEM